MIFWKLFFHHPRGIYLYEIITIAMNGCKYRHIYCNFSFKSQALVMSYLSVADLGISEPGCRSRGDRCLGSGDCFDAPSYIRYMFFVVRSSREYDTSCTCWLQLKNMHLKFTKTHPPYTKKKSSKGRAPSWIRLCLYTIDFVEIGYHYTFICEDAAFIALSLMVIKQHVMLNATTVTRGIWQEFISEFQWYSHLFVVCKCLIYTDLCPFWLLFEYTRARQMPFNCSRPSLPLSNLFKMKISIALHFCNKEK